MLRINTDILDTGVRQGQNDGNRKHRRCLRLCDDTIIHCSSNIQLLFLNSPRSKGSPWKSKAINHVKNDAKFPYSLFIACNAFGQIVFAIFGIQGLVHIRKAKIQPFFSFLRARQTTHCQCTMSRGSSCIHTNNRTDLSAYFLHRPPSLPTPTVW